MCFARLKRCRKGPLIPCVLLVALLLSLGCSEKSATEGMLTDYQNRIAGLTGFDIERPATVMLLPWPAKRERLLAVPQQRASMADWFRLRDCRLFALINERNSILGRVHRPSQRLIYEVEFIALARECLAKMAVRSASAAEGGSLSATYSKLEAVLAEKLQALPAVLWNSTVGSDEFAAMVRVGGSLLAQGNDVEASAASAALLQWLSVQQRAFSGVELSASDYEAANKVLAQSQWLSQLYRGQQLAIQTLQAAAMSLERRLEKPLCYRQKSNRKSQAFRNVFQRYYAGRVQPYLAQLKNQQRQAALLLQPLFEPFKNKPAAVVQWAAYYQSDFQGQFDAAISRHTKAWQALLGQCGLMPGTAAYRDPVDSSGIEERTSE